MSELEHERQREEDIRRAVGQLPDAMRKLYYGRMRQRVKDPDSYAVLNYLFVAGLHHFYLGKIARGAVNLAVFCFGMVLFMLQMYPLAILVIAVVTVVELPALFRSQLTVLKYNNDLADTILKELQSQSVPQGVSSGK